MRARTRLVAGLLAGFAAACAGPAERTVESADAETEPRDLSLLDAPAAASVLSDIEAGDIEPVPARRHQSAVSAAPQGDVHAEHVRPQPTEPAPFVMATAGTVTAPAVAVPRSRPTVMDAPAEGAADATAAGSGDAEDERPSTGRGILIRGGVGVDDDCALHMPGGRRVPTVIALPGLGQPTLGAPGPGESLAAPEPGAQQGTPNLVRPAQGALVNDRGPRTGLPRAGRGGGIRF